MIRMTLSLLVWVGFLYLGWVVVRNTYNYFKYGTWASTSIANPTGSSLFGPGF